MLTLLCGTPGSGKSTYAKSLNIPVLSEDELLKEITNAPSINHAIFSGRASNVNTKSILYGRIMDNVVIDGLFLYKEQRKHVIDICHNLGLKIRCVLILCDSRIARARNLVRTFPVDFYDTEDPKVEFDYPSLKEGFDELIVVNTGDFTDKVYLVRDGDNVLAYGDSKFIDVRSPDMVISVDKWISVGCLARVENNKIILGKSDMQKYNEYAERVRAERYLRLCECDSISPMRWADMDDSQKEAWIKYRRELLDITKKDGFPWCGDISKIPWPSKPE